MKFYKKQHRFYCGVDLHVDALYVCVLDATGEVVVHKNIPTRPKSFLKLIKPYGDGLVVGCECMFAWYWLADLCSDEGINFVLDHHAHYIRAIFVGMIPKGPWRLSKTLASHTGMTNQWLKDQGLLYVKDLWVKIHYPFTAR